MSEPTITCPTCKTEIRLTESLAAPLLAATREDYERRLSEQEAEVAKREERLRAEKAEVEKARRAVEDEIAERLKAERATIAQDEVKRARLAVAAEADENAREFAELQEVARQLNVKLAEAQKAQADCKLGGAFNTPRCWMRLLVEMLEPYWGRAYDPCCGSGGISVQSLKFIHAQPDRNGDGGRKGPTTMRSWTCSSLTRSASAR